MNTTTDDLDINECIKMFTELSESDDSGEAIVNKQVVNWLTELKNNRVIKSKSQNNGVIIAKQISDTIKEIYDTTDVTINRTQSDSYLITTPFCLIELHKNFLMVSFEHNTTIVAAANLTLLLTSLFKGTVTIGEQLYMIDPVNGNWYWGEEEIKNYYERNQGKKVSPIIHYGWFDDQSDKGMPHC